jgi:hypothetical protein
MTASQVDESRLLELETLTRDYARYSRSAGGLASVLGGVFCLGSYLAGGLLPLTPSLRVALVALPLVWVLLRQWLVRRYYQRYGRVEEQVRRPERVTHACCVATVVGVAAWVTFAVVSRPGPLLPGDYGYLALVWLLAPVVWLWLRSPLDFIVGTFLFCQAAVTCAGFTYPVVGTGAAAANPPMALMTVMFPLAAVAFVVAGIAEHRRFLALRERLDRLHGGAAA